MSCMFMRLLPLAFLLFGYVGSIIPASAATSAVIEQLLQREAIEWSGRSFDATRLRATYENRAYQPVWLDGLRLNAHGKDLLDEATNSYRDGLDPGEYLGGVRGFNTIANEEDAARLELALSNMFLTLGRDLFSGLTTPSVTDPNIVIKRKNVDAEQWLDGAAATSPKDMFRSLRPRHPQYAQLRQMLGGYRSLLLRGGWKPIDNGETLKPGMVSPRIVQLRANLAARGYDSMGEPQSEEFGDGLKEALTHFQKRHGLTTDGAVGPNTLRALNVSAQDRVKQLAINLERWRWLPRDLGRQHVLVNQAGFELFMMDGKETVDRRRVIVGKPFHQSPMFSDEIIYAEFNPTWTVPRSIAGKEMLPKIRNNPAFLQDKGYDLYTSWAPGAKPANPFGIDWSTVSSTKFPYRIVQGPGPRNALGRVKFIFPNKFSVYLHDTPSRNLFSRSGRAFSHGCIRVEKPLDFARKIYSLQGGLNPASVDEIVASKKRKRVNLKRKLPVHLAYFTAWIDDDGVPLFFDDVYKRDQLVEKFLF